MCSRPLVHLSTSRRAEIVLLGDAHPLRAPFSVLAVLILGKRKAETIDTERTARLVEVATPLGQGRGQLDRGQRRVRCLHQLVHDR